jgi:hypothetical protein
VGPTNAPTPAPPTPAPTPCIANDFILELTTDNYPAETSWTLKNSGTGSTVGDGGGYSDAQTLHIEELCIPNADYEFTISDSWGDGICCAYGSGSYVVKVNGVEKASGGQFGSSETKTFEISGSSPTLPPTIAPTPPPPTASPTNAVVDSPSAFPTGSTRAPVSRAPVTPSASPVSPTVAPVSPTVAPVTPTSTPSASPTQLQGTLPPTACVRPPDGFALPFVESFNSYPKNLKKIPCWENDNDFGAGIIVKGGNNKHVRVRRGSELSVDFDVRGLGVVEIKYRRRVRNLETPDRIFIGYHFEDTETVELELFENNASMNWVAFPVDTTNHDKLYLSFEADCNAKSEYIMLDHLKVTEI